MFRLQKFDITVTYKSRRRQQDADALSRCALSAPEDTLISHDDVLALSPFDVSSFAAEQLKDLDMSALIHHLDCSTTYSDNGFIRKSRHFVLLDGFYTARTTP